MPVMAPALKASSRPPASELIAACAVRTLARTDTFMPMKPAAPDRTAPISEADRHQPAEQIADDQEDHDADDGDGGVLALEIGLRAFAHRRGDLLHPRRCRRRPASPTEIAQMPYTIASTPQRDDQPTKLSWNSLFWIGAGNPAERSGAGCLTRMRHCDGLPRPKSARI